MDNIQVILKHSDKSVRVVMRNDNGSELLSHEFTRKIRGARYRDFAEKHAINVSHFLGGVKILREVG